MISKEIAAERKAKGICVRCGKAPSLPKGLRCQPCRDECNALGKAWRERHIANGMCGACGKHPLVEGRRSCESCLAKGREAKRAIQSENNGKGLCRCGKSAPAKGKKLCDACLKGFRKRFAYRYHNDAAFKSWWLAYRNTARRQYAENGQCTGCGQQAAPGKTKCATCLAKASFDSMSRRAQRIAKGVCPWCEEPTENGNTVCVDCQQKYASMAIRKKSRRRSQGLCIKCGVLAVPGRARCGVCYLKDLSRRVLGETSRWVELKALFDGQDSECAYTGRRLILGLDTSLDHIKPKSCGGDDSIRNLQWVYRPINMMKWRLSESEFLALVSEVSREAAKTRRKRAPVASDVAQLNLFDS